MPVVAIDGPAGSGKSTVARAVAERLGVAYLDTGAMYRSVSFAALRDGVDPADGEALAKLAGNLDIGLGERVLVDGIDATAAIRGADVTAIVSTVSAHPAVRADMVRRQREWAAEHGGGVAEGRDIGTVVFPDADVKVFLTASEEERARRRQRDDRAPDVNAVAADLARRDALDSNRATSPLVAADDAVVIDTTGRTVDD
ncbi:MAG: (d)CMP kinase, partial [Acidimicrobiia bacterium]|nr:(d)CMP kinase [Acidimicrobiia bacterium]